MPTCLADLLRLVGMFPPESQGRFDWCYSTVGGGCVLRHLVGPVSRVTIILSCLFAVVRFKYHCWFRGMHHSLWVCLLRSTKKSFQVQFWVSNRATHPRGLEAVCVVRYEVCVVRRTTTVGMQCFTPSCNTGTTHGPQQMPLFSYFVALYAITVRCSWVRSRRLRKSHLFQRGQRMGWGMITMWSTTVYCS